MTSWQLSCQTGEMPFILVVDDQEANRVTLERILLREGWEVAQAVDGRSALEQVRECQPDVVVTDLKMPGMDGLELLRAIKAISPEVEVLMMTAYATVETAVDAMKEGAWDYVTKPLRRTELVSGITKALERQGLVRENKALREQIDGQQAVVGCSPAMNRLMEEIQQVAPTDASVLFVGESGTGKGLLARALHRRSRRPDAPLITVNCGAIPENLLESEMFGHESGAFTGANKRKEGRFDLAAGGSIFLDEVTDLPQNLQVKLLRVLQDGEYERVGGTRTIQADARVISATNLDLDAELESGRFRKDLYYRLNVIQICVPPLRDRIEDVPLLATHFLEVYGQRNQKSFQGFSPKTVEMLCDYPWPGNVRELENAIERAVVLCRGNQVEPEHLPPSIRESQGRIRTLTFSPGTPLRDMERQMIEETLRHCSGDKTLAANLLGITARTLYRREAAWSENSNSQESE
jgi:two-component system response regulator HydG